MLQFNIIVAVDKKLGIGKNGTIPWHLKADMRHFKEITTSTTSKDKKNAIIMGRVTWESLPDRFRPLPGRINVVLTRNKQNTRFPQDVLATESLDKALALLKKVRGIEKVFVIGGAKIYREAIEHSCFCKLYLTIIKAEYGCDVFFPDYKGLKKLIRKIEVFKEDGVEYLFEEWQK